MGYGKGVYSTNYVGNVYESNNFGKFKVIREILPIGYAKKTRLFEIEFLNTGYRTIVSRQTFYRDHQVKDRLVPTIYGIGYLGQEELFQFYEHDKKLYKVWEGIISRCYNTKDNHYKNYGGIGIIVSDDWLSYRNFEKDVKLIYGYNRKILEPDMFHLDKDYLQRNIPAYNRIYSKETCIWISLYENALVKGLDNGRIKYFGVILDTGYYYTRIYHKLYGRFEYPEDAAMMFNYLYPVLADKKYMTIDIHNDVPYVSFKELMSRNLLINRKDLDPILPYLENYN